MTKNSVKLSDLQQQILKLSSQLSQALDIIGKLQGNSGIPAIVDLEPMAFNRSGKEYKLITYCKCKETEKRQKSHLIRQFKTLKQAKEWAITEAKSIKRDLKATKTCFSFTFGPIDPKTKRVKSKQLYRINLKNGVLMRNHNKKETNINEKITNYFSGINTPDSTSK